MNQITTHILDTSKGTPAAGITIRLQQPVGADQWEDICTGVTNADGRIPDFLGSTTLTPGVYRMYFETQVYFNLQGVTAFYPYIPVVFTITDQAHYHVPLLLNPYGYSTYRGS